ncbi:MAG: ABC transporter ATP-binding protein [Armatimonadetes bacterium]|nr:ABC transporter ATP-binding protein [Armatimonadota bacterium]
MKTDALIRVEGLSKEYVNGEIRIAALDGVNLTISRGEFVAITGPSGSGKSTFMNMIGCLDKPTKGQYLLEGVPVQDMNDVELAHFRIRRIGFVFQNYNLIPRTTSLGNVEMPLVYSAVPERERKRRALEILRMMGLEDRIHHFPNQLSGGQQQRVAIARALVNNPTIILADEPTGNLDTKTSMEVVDIFRNLNEQEGITILLITHERDVAEFCRRIVCFRDGRILQDEAVSR